MAGLRIWLSMPPATCTSATAYRDATVLSAWHPASTSHPLAATGCQRAWSLIRRQRASRRPGSAAVACAPLHTAEAAPLVPPAVAVGLGGSGRGLRAGTGRLRRRARRLAALPTRQPPAVPRRLARPLWRSDRRPPVPSANRPARIIQRQTSSGIRRRPRRRRAAARRSTKVITYASRSVRGSGHPSRRTQIMGIGTGAQGR